MQVNFDAIVHFLGPQLVELGCADLRTDIVENLGQIASRCPNLVHLDIAWAHNEEVATRGLLAVARECRHLQELHTQWLPVSSEAMAAVAAGCPNLRVWVAGESHRLLLRIEGLRSLCRHKLVLDTLDVELGGDFTSASPECAEGAAVLLQTLDVKELVLRTKRDQDDDLRRKPADAWATEAPVDSMAMRPLIHALSTMRSAVDTLGLHFCWVTEGLLNAAGSRLRVLDLTGGGDGRRPGESVLPVLAATAAAGRCPNLEELSIHYYEQVDPLHLAQVAAGCPHLAVLDLNTDEMDFQLAPIDAGVRALGEHCPEMRHLDLYDRCLSSDGGAEVIAGACAQWPQLRYLCVANTGVEWPAPAAMCLPHALSAYCPLLQELVVYSDVEHWRPVISMGCPWFSRLDGRRG